MSHFCIFLANTLPKKTILSEWHVFWITPKWTTLMICFWTWSRGKKTMQTRHWCKCLTNIWENLKWLLNIIFSYFPRDHVRGWLEYLPIDRKAHERVRDQVRKMIMINMNLFVQFSVASPSSLVALYLMCHSYCCWPSPPDGIWGPLVARWKKW